jgi:hypothetical protein
MQLFIPALSLLPLLMVGRQLSAPKCAGVAMGHLHYRVPELEANKKFWIAPGGQAGSALPT